LIWARQQYEIASHNGRYGTDSNALSSNFPSTLPRISKFSSLPRSPSLQCASRRPTAPPFLQWHRPCLRGQRHNRHSTSALRLSCLSAALIVLLTKSRYQRVLECSDVNSIIPPCLSSHCASFSGLTVQLYIPHVENSSHSRARYVVPDLLNGDRNFHVSFVSSSVCIFKPKEFNMLPRHGVVGRGRGQLRQVRGKSTPGC
jgi:hypothetical protein